MSGRTAVSRQGLDRDWTWRVTCWRLLLLFVPRPPASSVHMRGALGWVHCLVGWEGPCAPGVGSDQEGASTLGVELGSCPPCAMWRPL